MGQFWDQSWSTVDMDRVNAYIGRMEMTSDPIIEYLRERQGRKVYATRAAGVEYIR